MPVTLSDSEIRQLVEVAKLLPKDYQSRIIVRPKRGHKESELDIKAEDQNDFRIILRQSQFNAFDFSAILVYRPPKTNQLFRLRRYNGKSHQHTNTIEGETFYDYHIHMATQRYQEIGGREDSYAVPTNRYADLHEAISCMISDCHFDLPPNIQGGLFGEV